MSWTKTEHWDALCEMQAQDIEIEEMQQFSFADYEPIDETQIDFFSDYKIDHAGREAFECPLCGKLNDVDFPHKECSDEEKWWAEQGGDFYGNDIPF